ncbi:hypothetical protein AX774_g362 [Zancudomyces culisetae]|uniref:Uncharacterized protein n=1 Tax=Zancudomyces culisetae TaxID=1213189 RepID=A0A1R1PYT1_ZANCU|nr:hypothetical protein AX774_g362 [Zancudomyces culisetae]|eukprot:OMH86084.1 hypothetical protein AX774_g362 [Zancudomyces culisetae]
MVENIAATPKGAYGLVVFTLPRNAPIAGPMVKPRENAIPTSAISFVRFPGSLTSAMMHVDICIFASDIPEITLASKNKLNLCEYIHTSEPAIFPNIETRSTLRRPNLSTNLPYNGATTHCRIEYSEPKRPPSNTMFAPSLFFIISYSPTTFALPKRLFILYWYPRMVPMTSSVLSSTTSLFCLRS